jgi:uncharacterized membrane protein YebE (DUF533 family)
LLTLHYRKCGRFAFTLPLLIIAKLFSLFPIKDMLERKIKLEHFKNLVAVAAADGYLNFREREFLTDRAEEAGLSEEEIEAMLLDAEKLRYMVPFNQVEREEQLNDAIFMSIIDGEIAEEEYQLCLCIAEKLGLKKDLVDTMVDEVERIWAR